MTPNPAEEVLSALSHKKGLLTRLRNILPQGGSLSPAALNVELLDKQHDG